MEKQQHHQIILKGEVAEILTHNRSVKVRFSCKPGTLLFEIPSTKPFLLGDEVIITGNFICENIEYINEFYTNH
ncbi:MAG: hypothetical protein CVU09_08610 [Bacteroidetes bacterium HGW-Bacteroidetes-4]|jgi:hypothetical protein|nr:MAG: hypothetical protein CVU09_08610 [Bacteroidetes bacterium HGW-Bacteroidetes-4]